MVRVYGGCVEPEGMELEDETYEVSCPVCDKPAKRRHWEDAAGGSINQHSYTDCPHCGHFEGDGPDDFD